LPSKISLAYHHQYRRADRVEKIASILIDYLKLNQNKTVENDNAVVKFDSKTKIITYQNKINPQEYLTAQYVENKWLDLGTNISQTKESYFTNIAAVNLAKLQSKKPKPTNNDFPGDKSRKRTR
jgi:hypothetical protein